MDRRRSPRISVQLPVEVWGLDASGQAFMETAKITNMSSGGVVIQGIRRRMRTGEVLDVRMGRQTANFRVVWVGEQNELGMQALTHHAFVPPSVLMHCSQAAGAC
jgi:hypothetical protein